MQSSRDIIHYVFFTGNVPPLAWVRVILDLSNPCWDKLPFTSAKGETLLMLSYFLRCLKTSSVVWAFLASSGHLNFNGSCSSMLCPLGILDGNIWIPVCHKINPAWIGLTQLRVDCTFLTSCSSTDILYFSFLLSNTLFICRWQSSHLTTSLGDYYTFMGGN